MSAPGPIYRTLASLPVPQLPQKFLTWTPGETFLSSNSEVFFALTAYLVSIFVGRWYMSDKKAYRLQPLFMLHNFLLSAGSFLLLALFAEELYPIIKEHGFLYGICHVDAFTPRLETFYIVNYYFKYWELADTAFLVVKKKPLIFLHYYHHSATALLCFLQLNGRTSVSWTIITMNLMVHVLMYYYYFMTAAGYKIWWKKYLTTMQITQFIVDLAIVYFAAYSYFATEYFPNAPTMGTCAGSEPAAISGVTILSSYLFLFVAFYKKTYNASKKAILAEKKTQ